jgi:hypothetical protein
MRARLSKDGEWVVCAVQSCGVRFAERLVAPEWIRYRNPGSVAGLSFLPGFNLDREGRWRMSKRVWKRLAMGRPPAYRRSPAPDLKMTPSLETAREPARRFPAVVVCPACGSEQILEVEALSLGASGLTEFAG